MLEFQMPGASGGSLYCRRYVPADAPRGVVQIVHGIAEHIGRYDNFAQYLAAQGFVVTAEDHMGHGKSIGDGQTPLFFAGGWDAAVADLHGLLSMTQDMYPGVPYFLFGHSMGSFLTRTLLYQYPQESLRGVILSGTGWLRGATITAGLTLCKAEEHRYGERGVSPLLQDMMFGAYNRHFQPARTKDDWICTDPAVVDAYTADPLCGGECTVGLAREMLRGIRENQKSENLEKMNHDLPVLFFAGEEDPVGNMGKGVRRSAEAFETAGMTDVTVKLYPGYRHEMINEPCREQVYEDVCHWMTERISSGISD